jgi:hypothetical protein
MWTTKLLAIIGKTFSRKKADPTRHERRLRLVQLEDRRVLNASLGLAGIALTGGEGLTITDGGLVDVGSGDAVQTVDLTVTTGTWDAIDPGDIADTFYDLDGTSQILTLDAALIQDGGLVLTAGDVLNVQGDAATTDTLVLDLSGIDFIPTGGLSYTAGEGAGDADSLEITGYSLDASGGNELLVTHTGSESGAVTIGSLGTVTFAETEPLVLGGTAANLVINLPAGADATVVLSDDGAAANGISQIDGLFELTTFTNPTNSLTINDGTGVKAISVIGLDANFSADLSILEDDGTADNSVTFQTNATNTGGGDLTVEADTIAINAAITTIGGNVDIDAVTSITSDANGDITTTATADSGIVSGSIDIDASGTGTVNLSGDLITTGADHAAGDGSAAGVVTVNTANGTIAVSLVNANGGADGAAANTGGAAADITIDTGSGNTITLNTSIFAVGGTGGTPGAGANILVSDPALLAADLTLSSGSGDVTFSDTLNGAFGLTVNSTGATIFGGVVGGVSALTSLTTDTGGTVSAVNVTTTGAQTYGENATLNGTYTTTNSLFTVGGTTTLAGNTAVNTGTGNVTFAGAANADAAASNRTLSVTAGTGTVDFQGDVGSTDALRSFTIVSATNLSLNAVTTQGGFGTNTIDLGSASAISGTLTLRGDLRTDGAGPATATGNIRLDATNQIVLEADTAGTAGSILLQTNDGGAAADGSIVFAGVFSLRSATAFEDGLELNVGANNVTLAGSTLQDLDHLSITTDAANSVTIPAPIIVGDGVGNGGTAFGVSTGTLNLNANVNTDADTTNAGNVLITASSTLLGANVVIDSDHAAGTDGNVTIAAVDADAAANNRTLTVTAGTGTAQFSSTVGATDALADFDVTAALIRFGGNVTVDAGAAATTTLTGNVQLDGNVAIDLDGAFDHSLVVTGTVNADAAANNRTLSVTADTGDVDFQGDVGTTDALRSFTIVSATNLSLNAVTTQGGFGTNTIDLGLASAISGTLTLRGDLRTDGAGPATATGNIRLDATNQIVLEADTAGTAGSILLQTNDGGAAADGSIVFAGVFSLRSATAFEDGLELNVGANNVTLAGSTLQDLDHLSITTDAANSVTIPAPIIVGDGVGNGGTAFGVSTGTLNLNANVNTDADTTNAGNVLITASSTLLGANVVIDSDHAAGTDGNVTIAAVDADAAANNRTLTVTAGTGTAQFSSTVGATDALADFDVTAALIRFGGNVTVDAGAAATTTLTGNVQLDGNVAIDLDGAADHSLVVTGTVNADAAANNRTLSVTADTGTVDFQGDIGTTQAVESLTVVSASTTDVQSVDTRDGGIDITSTTINLDGATLSSTDQATAGAIALTGSVVLNTNVAITTDSTTDANMTITGPVNADAAANFRTLNVTAGTGTVQFTSTIGAAQALADFDVTAALIRLGGNVTVDAGAAATTTLTGNVQLDGNVAIDLDGAFDHSLVVTGTVNADAAANNRTLSVTADTGDVDFQGDVGTTDALRSFTIVSATNLSLNAVTTQGGFGTNTIDLGLASAISGTLTLRGDLRTDGAGPATATGNIRLDATNQIVLEADTAGTAGSILLQTNDGGAAADGSIVFAGVFSLRSATAFEDGLELNVGANNVTLAGSTLQDLDHLSITTDAANSVTIPAPIIVGDGVGNGGTAFGVSTGTLNLNANVNTDADTTNAGNVLITASSTLLGANVVIDSDHAAGTDGNVTIAAVDADAAANNRTLTVTAGTGTAQFSSTVGATDALADFDVTAALIRLGGNVTVDAGAAATTTLTGNVQLDGNVAIDLDGAADHSLVVTGTVNADAAASNRTLSVVAGTGTAQFDSAIGDTQALADFDVTAGLIRLGGNVTVNAGAAATTTLTGDVQLDSNVAFDLDGAADHNLVVTGTVNADAAANNRTLGVTADTGTVDFQGDIGTTQAVESLTVVSASTTDVQIVDTRDGGISITSTTINLDGATLSSTDQGTAGAIALTGSVVLNTNVLISTDSTTDANVTITGPVNADAAANFRTLNVTAGTGTAQFTSTVGVAQALADFDVTAALIRLGGNVTVDAGAAATTTLDGNVQLDGNVAFDLDGAADHSLVVTGTVNADVNTNNRTLSVTADTGTVDFQGDIGTTQAVESLTVVSASTTDVQSVDTRDGGIDITSTTINLDGATLSSTDQPTAGAIALTGSVVLNTNVAITTDSTTDANMTITGPVNADAAANNRTLNVTSGTGTARFTSTVGAAQALADFDVTAALIRLGGNVTVDVGVAATTTLDGNVQLDNNVTIDLDGAVDHSLFVTGTVNADAAANLRTLNVIADTGTARFASAVGNTQSLADFDVMAALIRLGGNVTVDVGAAATTTLDGDVQLDGNVAFDLDGAVDHSLVVTGTVNADVNTNNRTLSVTADTGTVDFQGDMGLTQAVESLTVVSASTTDVQSVDTRDGGINIASTTINLDGATLSSTDQGTAGAIALTGSVVLNTNVLISTDSTTDANVTITGPVNADAAANFRTLNVTAGTGTAQFTSTVGVAQALADFDVTAALIRLGGNVTVDAGAAATTTLDGNVQLDGNVAFDLDGAADHSLVVTGTVNADVNTNNRTLSVTADTGTVDFQGDIGTTQAVESLTVVSASTTDVQSVDTRDGGIDITSTTINLDGATLSSTDQPTAGAIALTGSVVLNTNVAITTDSTTDANMTITGPVNADAAANNRTLNVTSGTGTARFTSTVGAAQALADFDVTAALIRLGGNVTVDVGVAATTTLDGNVQLDNNVTIDLDGAVDHSLFVTGTVNADAAANLRTLNVIADTGTARFASAVGNTQSLADFDVMAALIRLGGNVTVNVGAAATTTLDGNVQLDGNVAFGLDGAADHSLVVTGTVNADVNTNDRTLDVTADTGTVDFQGDIGPTQAVESLTVVSASTTDVQSVDTRDGGINITSTTINLDGATLSSTDQGTAGTISLTGSVVLNTNVLISTDSATDANVTIDGTVNADAAANFRTLNVIADTGTARFTSAIGNARALADFDVMAALIRLGGNVRVDVGAAATTTLDGDVQLDGNVAFDLDGAVDHSLVVTGTVNADLNTNNRTLSVTADAGTVDFQVDIGTIQALESLTVVSASTTDVQSVDTRDGGISITSTTINLDGATLSSTDQPTAGAIALTGSVMLNTNVAISTDSTTADATIMVTGTVDGAGGTRDLTLTAGTGNIAVTGDIGGSTPLGVVLINSAGDLALNAVTAGTLQQVAGTGSTTLNGVVSTTTAAGISITTNVDITANGNLTASAAGAEAISLAAGDDIVIAPTASVISTRDAGGTPDGDAITIIADSDQNGVGGVTLPLAAGFSIETDGGIAKQFAQRPVVAATDAFFFAGGGGPIIASLLNETVDNANFRSEWDARIGMDGEENLRVDIDWRDPKDDVDTYPNTSTGNPVTSSREQFLIIDGDSSNDQVFGHVYTALDLVDFVTAGVPFFVVDFSVSHDASISVQGASISQQGATNPIPAPPAPPAPWLISSTDNAGTGTGVANPATDVTNLAESNIDLHWEGGLFEVSVPVLTLPIITPEVPPPPPQPTAAPPPAIEADVQVFVTVAQSVDFPYSSYTTQSEDYFQLRHSDGVTLTVVDDFERISDEFGELLLQPLRLKQWVESKDFDGPGYELWLITTKRTKDGATLKIERPVLKFDVVNDQPFPAEETLPDVFPELHLQPMPHGGDDATPESDMDADAVDTEGAEQNPDDDADSNAEQAAVGNATFQFFTDPRVVPGVNDDGANESGQATSADQSAQSVGMARSAIAGLAVSGVMTRSRTKPTAPSRHTSFLNRLFTQTGTRVGDDN